MFFDFLNGCQSADSNLFMFCSSKLERKLSVFISVGSQILLQSLFSDKGRIKQATCSRPLPFEKLLNGFKHKPLAVGVKTPNDFIKSRRNVNYLRLGRHGRNLSLNLIHDFGIMNINTLLLCTIIAVYYYELRFISPPPPPPLPSTLSYCA